MDQGGLYTELARVYW